MTGIKPRMHNLLKLLSSSQVRKIHEASMAILEKVGVVFEEERAIELFGNAGDRKSVV